MANATIQFTQGLSVIPAGQSAIGFVLNTDVTLTDAAGGGASSYLWEIISWPGPLTFPPNVLTSTSQVATVQNPTSDGIYIVKLTRTDGSGTTTDLKFFGIGDDNGLYLPSAGMTGTMSNVGGLSAAQAVGWAGRASASNVFLDAYLRTLKGRSGLDAGKLSGITVDNSSTSPGLYQVANRNGVYFLDMTRTSGAFVLQLGLAGDIFAGAKQEYLVNMNPGCSNLSFQSGVGGGIKAVLVGPPAGTASVFYHLRFVTEGSEWNPTDIQIVDTKVVPRSREFLAVVGTQATGLNVFSRVGTVMATPSEHMTGEFKFQAILETTVGQTTECQLYNVTDGAAVSGSLLTTSSTTPDFQEAVVTLPSGQKLYEVQVRLGSVPGGSDRAAVTNAKLLLTWG